MKMRHHTRTGRTVLAAAAVVLCLLAFPAGRLRADTISYGIGMDEVMIPASNMAPLTRGMKFLFPTRWVLETGYEFEGEHSSFDIIFHLRTQYFSTGPSFLKFTYYDQRLTIEPLIGAYFLNNEYWKIYLKGGVAPCFTIDEYMKLGPAKTNFTIFSPLGKPFTLVFDLVGTVKTGAAFFLSEESFLYLNGTARYNIPLSKSESKQGYHWSLGFEFGFGYRLE